MSCPNRDGHIGTGGCIFCSAKGSGDFAGDAALTITEQLAAGKKDLLAKRPVHSYVAYFQAFTNTYAPGAPAGKNLHGSHTGPGCQGSLHRHPSRLPWKRCPGASRAV